MTKPMTRKEEYEFYADPDNQTPQGRPRQRGQLTEMVPVRFAPEMLEAIRRRADDEDRSVSNWIRRAVERELGASAGQTSGQTNDDRPTRTEPNQRSRKAAVTRTKSDQPGRRGTRKAAS
ncbi:MAG TPA: YlcI/YnfO family protein [Acidimicrobiales bacterium]|nr:YlcI/YnfO family protein [Acidimicrobiales bacterium]